MSIKSSVHDDDDDDDDDDHHHHHHNKCIRNKYVFCENSDNFPSL